MTLKWTGTASDAELAKLTNKNNMDEYTDATALCNMVTSFKAGMTGVLDEVSFFANRFKTTADKDKIAGKLQFEGSADGTTWTKIFEVKEEVHEGWNTKLWDGSDATPANTKPVYNKFRFVGTAAGACRLGEIKIRGVEAKASTADTDVCTPEMTIDSEKKNLGAVTYDKTKTPKLTSITPRFGSVVGNHEVTLVGTGFHATEAGNTILFDNIPCVVKVGSASATSVICTTGPKIGVKGVPGINPIVSFSVLGSGKVATSDLVYRYVSLYSSDTTWLDF